MKDNIFLELIKYWKEFSVAVGLGFFFSMAKLFSLIGSQEGKITVSKVVEYGLRGSYVALFLCLFAVLIKPGEYLIFFLSGIAGGLFGREIHDLIIPIVKKKTGLK